jgi:carboxymethylenebutenolidase
MGSRIQLTASDGHHPAAYLAEPTPPNPAAPAVVIVQEIFGVNRHIRSVVDLYASEGFYALAPALLDRVQPGIELNYNSADANRGMQIVQQIGIDKALLDVSAAINSAAQSAPGRKVAVVGFCFGGTLAWLAATRLNPAAAVGYYGGQISRFVAEQPRCPVMLHFGAKDKHIPASDIQKIQQAHPEVTVFLYENAGHGFNCDHRPDYEPASAKQARERTLSFLRSHLQHSQSAPQ